MYNVKFLYYIYSLQTLLYIYINNITYRLYYIYADVCVFFYAWVDIQVHTTGDRETGCAICLPRSDSEIEGLIKALPLEQQELFCRTMIPLSVGMLCRFLQYRYIQNICIYFTCIYVERDSELVMFQNMCCRWSIGEEVEQLNDSKGHFEWDFVETTPKRASVRVLCFEWNLIAASLMLFRSWLGAFQTKTNSQGLGFGRVFLADHFPRVNLSNCIYT